MFSRIIGPCPCPVKTRAGQNLRFWCDCECPGVGLYDVAGDGLKDYIAQSGNQIIGTAVPEPATWTMMLAGLLSFAGFAMYRRRKQSGADLTA